MNASKKRSINKYSRIGALLIVLLLIVSLGVMFIKHKIDTLWYPRKFMETVEEASLRYGVEPNLIYAIIKAESGFTETAVSSRGAIGLMQIIPDTFLFDIRQHIGLQDAHSSELFKAEVNVLAGTYYFGHWMEYFFEIYELKDPTVEALAAYNAGISNVWRWLEDEELSDWNGLFIEKIPFEETREYVQKVLKYKEEYDELYGKSVLNNGRVGELVAYRWARRYGEEFNVDPCFVMAIIRAESSFDPRDLSDSGAAGLMQITKGTYADIKADLDLEEKYKDLFDPEFNVKCGTYYLHWVDDQVDGMAQIAAAYNAGYTAVKEWLSNPAYSKDGKTLIVENIPIDTTKRYVNNVLTYYEDYCARLK